MTPRPIPFRAIADVLHRNLVRLYELFVDDGHWYFSMELVAGRRFDRYVRPGGELDETRLRAVLPQLRDGVLALETMLRGKEPGLRPKGGSGADEALSEEQLVQLMRDPRYWKQRDPEILAKVTEGFRRLYPG